jgi:hypothetical protein
MPFSSPDSDANVTTNVTGGNAVSGWIGTNSGPATVWIGGEKAMACSTVAGGEEF